MRKLQALKLQQSGWEFDGLEDMRELADSIKSAGGKAFVVRKRVVYE